MGLLGRRGAARKRAHAAGWPPTRARQMQGCDPWRKSGYNPIGRSLIATSTSKSPQVPEYFRLPSRDEQRAAAAHAQHYLTLLNTHDEARADSFREGKLPGPPSPAVVSRYLKPWLLPRCHRRGDSRVSPIRAHSSRNVCQKKRVSMRGDQHRFSRRVSSHKASPCPSLGRCAG